MRLPGLHIKKTRKKGRGVFTTEAIKKETMIEIAPVIVMSNAEHAKLEKTVLKDYIFEWGDKKDKCAIALGYVSMYNHSYQSNCEYSMDFKKQIMFVKAVKNIKKGEELMLNYNGDCNSEKEIWFKAV